jgi:hypothetical protein
MSESKSYHDVQWAIYKARILKLLKNNRVDLRNTTGALPGEQLPIGGPAGAGYPPEAHAIGGPLHTGSLTDALHGNLSGGALHATVIAAGAAGFMTGADKTKLDGIASGATANTGTVTSVGLTAPAFLSVTGSPVTTSGTLALSLATQSANLAFAGPTTGAAAAPTFRSLVAADIPNLSTIYQPLDSDLTSIAGLTTTSYGRGFLPLADAAAARAYIGAGTGAGTVTSVALTAPAFLSIAGSPVTTSGTLALSLATQAANLTFAGPATGAAAAPTFRALVALDMAALLSTANVWSASQTFSVNTAFGSYTDYTSLVSPADPSTGQARLYASSRAGTTIDAMAYRTSLGLEVVLGRDLLIQVRNVSGATIAAGQVVYCSGSSASIGRIELAQADATMAKLPPIGVTTAAIANNANGLIMTRGVMILNTSGFSAGDTLYLSPTTPGAVTNVVPSHPNVEHVIGVVEYVNSSGLIMVSIVPINLHRIDGTNQATFAIGDGTGTTKSLLFKKTGSVIGTLSWNPTASRAITLPDVTGTLAVASATAGQVYFAGASGVLSGDSTLFWDNTNKRLGIGTASPGNALHILGANVGGLDLITGLNLDRAYGTTGDQMSIDFGNTGANGIARIAANQIASGEGALLFSAQTASGNGLTNELLRLNGDGSIGIGTAAPTTGTLTSLRGSRWGGGDGNGVFASSTIALTYSTLNQYPHFIHSRHNAGSTVGNAIDIYTGDGTAAGVYPTNATHGLTVLAGKVGVGTTSPTTKFQARGVVGSSGYFDADAVGAAEVEIMPAGGCVYMFMIGSIITRASNGTIQNTNAIGTTVPGAGSTSTTIATDGGSSTLVQKVYSTGQVTVLRTGAGSSTFKVAIQYVAL